jgi:hypothetical protein
MKPRRQASDEPQPPWLSAEEIDARCEQVIEDFCGKRYGLALNPIPTDALIELLESEADLDQYALDLDSRVHGVTLFFRTRKPLVRIDATLRRQHWREPRLRTTFTHEFGHVFFHAPLWRIAGVGEGDEEPIVQMCRYGENAPISDRLEWQAGYASGALLMPRRRVLRVTERFASEEQIAFPLAADSPLILGLIERVRIAFQVSPLAAEVRLKQLHILN